MNKQECCEQCYSPKIDDGINFRVACCKNFRCPCHSPQSQEQRGMLETTYANTPRPEVLDQMLNNGSPKSEAQGESWEEEFDHFIEPALDRGFDDGKFSQKSYRDRLAWREDIKSFIAKKLEEGKLQARTGAWYQGHNDGRKASLLEIREVIAKEKEPHDECFRDRCEKCEAFRGYTAALSDLDAAVERLATNEK